MPTMQLDRLSFKWTSSTIIAATLCIAPAKADDIKVTYTGFVSDNASNCGAVFGSGSIVGAEFTLTYQFDSSLGLLKSGEATSTLIGGGDENGQNAPGKGVLEIKGATYTV